MLDIRMIRENAERVQETARQKGISISIAELLEWDERRRASLLEVERFRQERNRLSQETSALIRAGRREAAEVKRQQAADVNDRLARCVQEHRQADAEYRTLLMLVPNIVSPDTPIGLSDQDNVERYRVGERPEFGFQPKDHVVLGELHGMIDIPRGVKTAGTRNYFLKGAGAILHRAVQQLAMDLLTAKGFTMLEVPLMVRSEALLNSGFFPLGQDQTYRIADGDQWLVGTSEVPLVSYFSQETIDVTTPIKLAAASICFRSEVGSAGKDVHGLYRVHQFAKVEQVVICEDDMVKSELLFQEITNNAEQLLQLLELPYRVMAVCTGDMSQKTYKQLDIETWMPSRQAYGETHSSSHLADFQARRSNIRYRNADGKLSYCHTLNNTAVASPRILIPLLENHQQEDGSIRIPQALLPYMKGVDRLHPQLP